VGAEVIKAGDVVMLVWACCRGGRRHLGWVGTVDATVQLDCSPCFCGYKTYGQHARVYIEGWGFLPLSWLIKVEPPAIGARVSHGVAAPQVV
jgi:hypothetical protein